MKILKFNTRFFQSSKQYYKRYLMVLFFTIINYHLFSQNNEVAESFGIGNQNLYYSIEEIYTKMDDLASTYPNICKPKYSIGNTIEGRPIYAFKISDNPNVDEPEPAVFYDSCHHGNEKIAMAVTINYMMWLCEQYGLNDEVKYLVDNREMYFVPVVNVDGYIKGTRKNRRPSAISNCYGVDLNRNYPVSYGNELGSSSYECAFNYRGTNAFSEPETRAIRDFVLETKPACAFSTHTPGGSVLMPSGNSAIPTEFKIYADLAAEMYDDNNYYYSTTKNALGYVSAGTTRDYLNSLGIIAYTPEVRYPEENNINNVKSVVAENIKPMRTLAWISGAYVVVKSHKLLDDVIPGSTFDMAVAAKNKGVGQTASNVTISVSSNNNNIIPTSSFIGLNGLPPQLTYVNNANPFSFRVSNNAEIGETAELEISVAIDGVQTDLHKVPIIIGEKNTLFADDAESNSTNWSSTSVYATPANNWSRDSANSYSGDYSFSESANGLASKSQFTLYTTNSINVNSSNLLKVQFAAKWSMGPGDYVILQANYNNNGWINKRIYTNSNDWIYEIIDFSDYTNGSLSLRFAHKTDNSGTGDGFYFDDFEVVDYTEPITCEQRDRLALTAVYEALNGNTWTDSVQWNLNLPINQWAGVTLDGNGCVYSLTLENFGLNGTLPMEIGNLSELNSLNLINNNINGAIPPTIGNLSKLEDLYLHDNQLSGSIPSEIGALTNLEYLSIRNNQLTGSIPSEIGNLVNLKSISLTNNQLTGSFPATIAALVNLKILHISNNQLTGNISTIDDLVSLESLYLSNNQFTGGITTINQLKNLKYLSLSNNKFVDNIPQTIGELTNLISLALNNNQFTGSIPSTIGNLTNITSLNLYENQLTGSIPSTIGNLENLTSLYLRDNQLSGNIPAEIANLNKLTSLSLSRNQLSGNIPSSIGALTELVSLYLDNNQLTGSIPSSLKDLTNLTYLYLNNNQLSGCYSNSLTELCDRLVFWNSQNTYISSGNNFEFEWEDFCSLGLGSCNPVSNCRQTDSLALINVFNALNGPSWCPQCNGDFSQPIDTWYGVTLNTSGCVDKIFMNDAGISGTLAVEIGELSEITSIDLMSNNIAGEIPSSIGNLKNLKELYLGSNQLAGDIPSSIGELDNLERLNLSNNQLTGSIPSTIGKLAKLSSLSLGYNNLSGTIPATIGELTALSNLSLFNNQLTGNIPAEIGDLPNLNSMYLQNNLLSGCYPANLFQLCDRLNPFFNNSTYISNGNAFDVTWSDFCATGTCFDRLASDKNISLENYPNPFKSETTINYTLEEQSKVSITIYNVLGEQVDVLIKNKQQQEGKQTTIFNGTNYPAGIYYCKVQTGDDYNLRKMILVK